MNLWVYKEIAIGCHYNDLLKENKGRKRADAKLYMIWEQRRDLTGRFLGLLLWWRVDFHHLSLRFNCHFICFQNTYSSQFTDRIPDTVTCYRYRCLFFFTIWIQLPCCFICTCDQVVRCCRCDIYTSVYSLFYLTVSHVCRQQILSVVSHYFIAETVDTTFTRLSLSCKGSLGQYVRLKFFEFPNFSRHSS